MVEVVLGDQVKKVALKAGEVNCVSIVFEYFKHFG